MQDCKLETTFLKLLQKWPKTNYHEEYFLSSEFHLKNAKMNAKTTCTAGLNETMMLHLIIEITNF